MMMRSSSTPSLNSLIHSTTVTCSLSGSPSTHHHQQNQNQPSERTHSFSPNHPRYPIPNTSCQSPGAGFRRVCSEGNIESLMDADQRGEVHQNHRHHRPNIPSSMRPSSRCQARTLESIPSFSVYGREVSDPGDEEECGEEGLEEERMVERSVTIGDSIEGGFSFLKEGLAIIGSGENPMEGGGSPLYLAMGIDINRNDQRFSFLNIDGDRGNISGGGGEGGSGYPLLTDSGGDRSDLEIFYKKMVEEHPYDALFLRNYAQFLYQVGGDLDRAEELYSRAILAEPGDGEILSQYAKLIWDLHHDRERASVYFEQAVQLAPRDSHVLAAYANFLWETEDESGPELSSGSSTPFGTLASASA